ncbi:MAG TPA: MFS transporter [Caldisericia bacterium]|nr:MFS transporter [Caldisericia bacterium]HOU08000.1 MFS transporter [Caldisericia bacterium]HPL89333.1 MFS transporter [Caldisericia bacterium]HQH48842.1 MFS transporter [Caldisericia bacterium]HQJ43609.1 MFS transporter [Caldisericia bacterium]
MVENMEDKKNKRAITKIVDFFGLKKSIVGMLSMVVLVGVGEHMAEKFLPLYMVFLGGGFISVGVLNFMDNFLGAIYSFPGGYLADRMGTKKSLLVFNLIAIAGYSLVIIFPYWPVVLIAATLFLSWTAISLPATMGLVSKALPKNKRTMGVSLHSLVRRLPMIFGPMLGGLLIKIYGTELGVRYSFTVALILALVAAVLQQILIEEDNGKKKEEMTSSGLRYLYKLMSPELKKLLVSDILIRICEQIPQAFVVLYVVGAAGKVGITDSLGFGFLTAIEMVTAILIYIPVAYFADKTRKKPFVVATFAFFTLFPVILLGSKSFPMLVAAFIIKGLKEFGEPTRKALIMDLAPENHKAGMFGLYYLIRDLIVSVFAFLGGILWMINPTLNLITAASFGVLGTLWFAFYGSDLPSAQTGIP